MGGTLRHSCEGRNPEGRTYAPLRKRRGHSRVIAAQAGIHVGATLVVALFVPRKPDWAGIKPAPTIGASSCPSWQSWFNGVWIPAFAGMTVGEHPPSPLRSAKGGDSSLRSE